MNENKDIKKLEQIKYHLRIKEKTIVNSQIKQNIKEKKFKKLEKRKNNIINNKKNIIFKIISFVIYNIIMLSIIFSFLSFILNNFVLTSTLIIGIYVSVISISVIGAYLSSRIEQKIKKYYYQKKLNIISNKLNKKKHEINLEIEKQEILKREITQTINCLDNIPPEPHVKNNNIKYENNIVIPKVRKKVKKIKKY